MSSPKPEMAQPRRRRNSMEAMQEIDPNSSSVLGSPGSPPLRNPAAVLSTEGVRLEASRHSQEVAPVASSTPHALHVTRGPAPGQHGAEFGSMLSVASSTHSVSYTTRTGKTLTIEEPVATVGPDGNAYNSSAGRWKEGAPLLKQKHIKVYLILSIIAIICFFPTGIPAFVFYRKTKEEYYKGLQSGEGLDKAQRYVRFCRNFLILSLVLFLALIILIISLAEKQRLGY